MNKIKKYYKIKDYSVKCRLYPNKDQSKKIDRAIHAVHVAHNTIMHEMFTELKYTKEHIDSETGETVHFPDFYDMGKSKNLKVLKEKYPIIKEVPAYALSGNNGVINDMKKRLVSQTENKTSKNSRPVEKMKPCYYTKSKPRKSYTYQMPLKMLNYKSNKVIKVQLSKIGEVTVRGFNTNLRFDENHTMTFEDYIKLNPTKQVTVTVSKDSCGDYWIIFKLNNVYKRIKENNKLSDIGIDVGVESAIITSEKEKYDNKKFKNKEEDHIGQLNKRLSRRYGYANIKFREENKKSKKAGNGLIHPSKTYLETKKKLAKLHRKVAFKRNNYNNNITFDIISKHKFIGIETLSVTDMYIKKEGETNKKRALRIQSLSDVCMSSILQMIRYKSNWYKRI